MTAQSVGRGELRWWHHLTGGRPMTNCGFAFVDIVVGKRVYYWRDAFGREWLAFGPWDMDRMSRLTP